jgi:hypothetical protein
MKVPWKATLSQENILNLVNEEKRLISEIRGDKTNSSNTY